MFHGKCVPLHRISPIRPYGVHCLHESIACRDGKKREKEQNN